MHLPFLVTPFKHNICNMKSFFYFFGLLLLSSSLAKAQCPTSISEDSDDGSTFIFYLSDDMQCGNYPAPGSGITFPITSTVGTGDYGVGSCQSSLGIHTVSLAYQSGTPILIGDDPISFIVNGVTCTYNSAGSLPLEWTAFNAQAIETGATLLTWATATETNNKGFDIEKSTDGVRFEKIGFVAGAGTTAQQQRYTFEDAAPSEKSASIIYYRLKQLDTDGQFEYSKIVSVRNNKRNTSIQVYPTTTSDVLRVAADGAPTDAVTVFNQMGQVVLTAQQVSSVDMSALPAGLYLVQVASGQEQVTERVFKQ
jgi:hypothetical protein